MLRVALAAVSLVAVASPAWANDWEKFFTPLPGTEGLIDSEVPPEELPSQGNIEADVDAMWQKGFAPIGYSYFNSSNTKTKDGLKLAKKKKARYIVVGTQYTGTQSGAIPITTPTTTTTYSSGNVNVFGNRGSSTGSYSGTSTTYGTNTTMMPFSVNRYDKFGIYFKEVPKRGIGIYYRPPNAQEVAQIETRRALVVRSIRDGSPAYEADLLPGDIILKVNDLPADQANWSREIVGKSELKIQILRNGTTKEMIIPIPPEWRS